jgi:adenylosuccinate synthase
MTTKVLVDLVYGDCGKARVVDFIATDFDINARFCGGGNSGHVVYVGETKHVLHAIPSGILNPHMICVVGNGCVVDPNAILDEIDELKAKGISVEGRLFISDRAHVTLPIHKENDDPEGKIGSTKKGIGPTYAAKAARIGLRTGNIRLFVDKCEEPERSDLQRALDRGFEKYICDTANFLYENRDKNILCESAQGTMLDVDHGTYPYVTSSNTVAGGACTGLGIGPTRINGVIGVFKAYDTRVGNGPFVTRMEPEIEQIIQKQGNEFGSTTGRPRQCGWLDLVALRYACRINGVTELAISKLDVLNGLESIKVCNIYMTEDGTPIMNVPARTTDYATYGKGYAILPGWDGVNGQTNFNSLPEAAQRFLNEISDFLEIPFTMISTGKERSQMISL